MGKCTPCDKITGELIEESFVPAKEYSLQEIRDKLHISKKLKDSTLLLSLNKVCNIAVIDGGEFSLRPKKSMKMLIEAKPENTFMDCVRHRLLVNDYGDQTPYYSYNDLSMLLYGKRMSELCVSKAPELYKHIEKPYQAMTSEIINEYNILRTLGEIVKNIDRNKSEEVTTVRFAKTSSGTYRELTFSEEEKIKSIICSTSPWRSYESYNDVIKKINEVLSSEETYGYVKKSFRLKIPDIVMSEEEVSIKIKANLYNHLMKIYWKDTDQHPMVKKVINKWARYQLGLGSDFRFADNELIVSKEGFLTKYKG